MHGAPIFSALAAEASGVDLVFLCLPSLHATVARTQSLNLQVHPFQGEELTTKDVGPILELLATMDTAVIGPGISRTETSLNALKNLIGESPCPLVLDASALQPWTLELVTKKHAVLTPHLGELERMGIAPNAIAKAAKKHGATIVLKAAAMRIAHEDGSIEEIRGGNAGLTVGGTGDALAGLIGGLLAQGVKTAEAVPVACTVIKRAATVLYPEYGYAFGTRRVIDQIPHLLHTLQ